MCLYFTMEIIYGLTQGDRNREVNVLPGSSHSLNVYFPTPLKHACQYVTIKMI